MIAMQMNQSWTKGFFIRAGGGWSVLVHEYDSPTENQDMERYGGTGYLVGLGYDFWLG